MEKAAAVARAYQTHERIAAALLKDDDDNASKKVNKNSAKPPTHSAPKCGP